MKPRYQLERRLGSGGMGEVWEGTLHGEAGFRRRVAIKRLLADSGHDERFVRMFLDEARIASRLHHANIVGVLDFGIEDGVPFQVLELVDGLEVGRLAELGREQGRPLPAGLALFICATVGHALHFAHQSVDDEGARLNVVHRDVSPQNVLISRAGDIKLSDFGIAFAEDRLEKTAAGVARGKPAYMAPEQAIRGAMDARTDVFSLGCVLCALLTGKSPLADENALVDLLAGSELSLEPLPVEVAPLLARALRRNKAERFASAEEFALACAALVPRLLDAEPRTALRDWVLSVAPTPTRLAARSLSIERPARAWPLVAIGLGSLALLTVAGVAFWPSTVTTAQPERAVAPSRAVDAVGVVDAGPPRVEAPAMPPPRTELPRPTARAVVRAQGTGVLAVGGETFLRAQVSIDGVAAGFAPHRFELPVGDHVVEVVTPTGQRFGPRRFTIGRQHTDLAPLVWVE